MMSVITNSNHVSHVNIETSINPKLITFVRWCDTPYIYILFYIVLDGFLYLMSSSKHEVMYVSCDHYWSWAAICTNMWEGWFLSVRNIYIYIHTHTYTHVYTYICVWVCAIRCACEWISFESNPQAPIDPIVNNKNPKHFHNIVYWRHFMCVTVIRICNKSLFILNNFLFDYIGELWH